MSKPEASYHTDETAATQLGIDTVTPRVLERMINVIGDQDLVLAIMGQSGIGKTAIPRQIAAKRGVPYAQIHMPTAAPESFQLPSLPKDGSPFFDQKIPRTFQELLAYAEAEARKHPDGRVPVARKAILSIEELNRAPDKSTTRSAFVMIGDRMIGDVRIPDAIQIVATMNPSGRGFSVNEYEKDPAMRRRTMLVYLAAEYSDFMAYAEDSDFHDEVIGYLRAHVSHFYDEAAARAGKVFACPATWEAVSRTCYALATARESLSGAVARAAYAGIIGTGITQTFIEYVKDRTTTVAPDDVLYRYGQVRDRVKKLLKEEDARLDRVTDLVKGLAVRVVTLPKTDRDPSKFVDNLALFLSDIPADVVMSFMSAGVDEAERVGGDTETWWRQDINSALVGNPNYRKMVGTYTSASMKADKEAREAGVK
jgi:hypothetical protein